MKRSSDHIDGDAIISSGLEWKCGLNVKTTVALLLSLLFLAFLVLRDPPSSDSVWNRVKPPKVMEDDHILRPNDAPGDSLLAGLLPSGFDRESCLSRHQSVLYHKKLKRQPSSYLISRLRSYEALHRRCGPHTESYKNNVGLLINSAGNNSHSDGCNYLVWIAFSGLGNRILTLASAFLYAVLTNRVLLVDPGNNIIPNLFCEPFPNTSWYLPKDFPFSNQFKTFDQNSTFCHGYMLKHNISAIILPFIYVHLIYDIDQHHKLFYSDKEQIFLEKIPWVVIRTDEYFVPSLFLIQSFKKDLENMFPDKDSVFHLLGRYLIHPTNPVWGLITRYYQAYLATADEKIGIQIRVFERETGPFQHILDQIISCTMKQHILPQIYHQEEDYPISIAANSSEIINIKNKKKVKAVLVTSLSPWYSEQIKNMYSEHPTLTGEVVGIFQPSQEEYQRTEDLRHNMKALAEIYLLSMSDVLVTSGWSTFGYVAQSLGGLRPWILYKPENRTAPEPPCRRAMSMEPCFHDPPSYDGADPHVKPCEDRSWGLKLVAA
nr:galactoside 2-alpha-L-fucosyltransferase-like [Ipomoea batatas]